MQKIKLYINLLFAGLLLSAIGLTIVLFSLSPDEPLGLLLFYFCTVLFSFFVFFLLGLYSRRLFGQRELLNQYFGASARQAVWFTMILSGSLALASQHLFSWINAGFLIGAAVFFEFFLASRHDRNT